MCEAGSNYRNLINRLSQEVYPELEKSLNNITSEDAGSLKNLLNTTIIVIQKELHSLERFEKKLIFPAILSLVDADEKCKDFEPNIEEIINLTTIKEERLIKCFEKVSDILDHEEVFNSDYNQQRVIEKLHGLTDIFYNDFIPEKKRWRELLVQLQSYLSAQFEKTDIAKYK
jgi:hypothetical protein